MIFGGSAHPRGLATPDGDGPPLTRVEVGGPPAEPVQAGLPELLAVEVDSCTDGELSDAVLGMARVLGQSEGKAAAILARWDGRAVWADDGAGSGAAWIAARTELSRQAAGGLLALARELRDRPRLAAALDAGVLGVAKVRLLLSARVGVEDRYEVSEATLVEAIRGLTVDHARIVLQRWRIVTLEDLGRNEPDGPEPDPEDRNDFRLSAGLDGRHLGSVNLDGTSASQVRAAIEAHVDARFQAGTYRVDDGMTVGERWARALVELVLDGAQPGTAHGRPRPSTTVVWDAHDLLDLPGDTPEEALARRRDLADGTRLPRPTAERLLCEGDVTDVLQVLGLDGAVHVLAVGHARRTADARQRAALELRDGGCAFPGCALPARWTDAHHIDPWSRCRRTDLDNLVLICRFHHHAVHEGGFRLWRTSDGTVHVTRPDGSAVPPTPHGHQVSAAGTGPPPWPPPATGSPPPAAKRPTSPTRFHDLTQRLWARERHDLDAAGPPPPDPGHDELWAAWAALDLGPDPVLDPSGLG